MKVLYTAHGSATGGREGPGASSDETLNVKLTTPKELGGNGATGTNPEQLFSVGYAACFIGALKFVAGQEKIKIADDTKVNAEVGIGPRDDGTGFGIKVALHVHIPGMDKGDAEALVKKADVVCPYSHATQGNIEKTIDIV